MFREALERVVEGTDGGMAGLLMDVEGIPLETYTRGDPSFDIEVVGAELSVLIKSVQRALEMLEAGDTKEVSLQSDRLVTVVRVLNETYFMALALEPVGTSARGDTSCGLPRPGSSKS